MVRIARMARLGLEVWGGEWHARERGTAGGVVRTHGAFLPSRNARIFDCPRQ